MMERHSSLRSLMLRHRRGQRRTLIRTQAIACTARCTMRLAYYLGQRHTTLAYPTDAASRIPDNHSMCRHTLRDHCAGSHHRIVPNVISAKDGAVCTERRAFADASGTKLMLALNVTSRIDHIRKNHTRTTKNIVLQNDAFIDGNIILDLDVMSDGYSFADKDILSERAAVAYANARADMHPMPYPGPASNRYLLIYDGSRMNVVFQDGPQYSNGSETVLLSRAAK